jgi:acetaldehyde dehydrogenase/alcohol dehydrogenase
VAVDAFDDQCTGANPRYPLISEFRAILLDSFYGRPFVELANRAEVENIAVAAKVNPDLKTKAMRTKHEAKLVAESEVEVVAAI